MKFLLLLVLSFHVLADASRDVFIRGKIGNQFDERQVKVTDSEGQTYFLDRSLFPQGTNFKQGQSFAIEVNEKELDKIKLMKK